MIVKMSYMQLTRFWCQLQIHLAKAKMNLDVQVVLPGPCLLVHPMWQSILDEGPNIIQLLTSMR